MFNRLALILFLAAYSVTHAQPCANGYFSITYKGARPLRISQTALNAQQESFMAGAMHPGPWDYLTSAWVSRISRGGTVLWSKKYLHPDYNSISVKDIVTLPDGGFIALLNAHYTNTVNSQVGITADLVLRANKHGVIQWAKKLNDQKITRFFGLKLLSNGNIVFAGSSGMNITDWDSPCHFFCLNGNGDVLWSNKISTPDYFFGFDPGGSITELRNGNIFIAQHHIKARQSDYTFLESGYFFVLLNPNGTVLWKRMFNTVGLPVAVFSRSGKVEYTTEQANGELSVYTSVNDSAEVPPPGYKKSLQIVLNTDGTIKETSLLHDSKPGFIAVNGGTTSNGELALFDDGTQPVLAVYDAQHNLLAQKGYGAFDPFQSPAAAHYSADGYRIFCNDREPTLNRYVRLIKTDDLAGAPCEELPVQLSKKTVTGLLQEQAINPFIVPTGAGTLNNIRLETYDFPIEAVTDCRVQCCTETVAPLPLVTVCGQGEYILPDGFTVKDSGMYSIIYQTAGGCDSIVQYHIKFPSNKSFKLGNDTCFAGSDTLLIQGPPGYDAYRWSPQISTSPAIQITRSGIYALTAANACGTYTDSIEVFEKCSSEIFMPGIFTPNGDGVNDLFGIDAGNKNHLVRFSVFNRWGQTVFSTTRKEAMWNGTTGQKPALQGIYVYSIEMRTADGKKVVKKKGTVMLAR